mmetsp:Transcript_11626/g.31352  ORF Transcript_11626/g.31352 Transcript_11626/m.31352 type:complete len:316 (-) Transcript_11626:22-969(-)
MTAMRDPSRARPHSSQHCRSGGTLTARRVHASLCSHVLPRLGLAVGVEVSIEIFHAHRRALLLASPTAATPTAPTTATASATAATAAIGATSLKGYSRAWQGPGISGTTLPPAPRGGGHGACTACGGHHLHLEGPAVQWHEVVRLHGLGGIGGVLEDHERGACALLLLIVVHHGCLQGADLREEVVNVLGRHTKVKVADEEPVATGNGSPPRAVRGGEGRRTHDGSRWTPTHGDLGRGLAEATATAAAAAAAPATARLVRSSAGACLALALPTCFARSALCLLVRAALLDELVEGLVQLGVHGRSRRGRCCAGRG